MADWHERRPAESTSCWSNPAVAIAAVTGAIRQAAQMTGASFQYLLATAQVEFEPQSQRPGFDLLGARSVPVHRADLAGDAEGAGARARLWSLCRRHHAAAVGPLRGHRPATLRPDPEPAVRSDRQRADGRRLHAQERGHAGGPARPRSDRGRTLHRAFSRPDGGKPADRACGIEASHVGGLGVPRSRPRQSVHLLRSARTCPRRRRGLSRCWSAATTPPVGRRRMLRRRRSQAATTSPSAVPPRPIRRR